MATALTRLGIDFILSFDYTSSLDLGDVKDNQRLSYPEAWTDGDAADKAEIVFHDQRTLTATSEDLDLYGNLTDAFGNTLSFAKVKAIFIKNKNTGAGENLIVGGAAANGVSTLFSDTTDKLIIGPDGMLLLTNPSAAGYAITGGTADLLKLDAGANTVVFDIVIVGTAA